MIFPKMTYNTLHNTLYNTFYNLGQYGPIILIIISWYLLWNHENLFFYYTFGIFASALINTILKGIIQQPRPMFDNKKIKLAKNHTKTYFYQNGIPFDVYGMPSGHAQMSFFTTIFIYLSFNKSNILYSYLLFSLMICGQRVKFDYHSIQQVAVGSIVGSLLGYVLYNIAREKIKNKITEKPDDNAPI